MATISDASLKYLHETFDHLEETLKNASSLQEAGQNCCDLLFSAFKESIVLVRFFATIAFEDLPEQNQAFVEQLSQKKDVRAQLAPSTLVLTLLGSRGVKSQWNEPSQSHEHLGIPLISPEFIDSIPMIARLFRALWTDMDWIEANEENASILPKVDPKASSGIFYVPDAVTTKDPQGRRVIASESFIRENGVKTVFGLGGSYVPRVRIMLVFFTREEIEESRVLQFMPLLITVKSMTMNIVMSEKLFF